MQDKTHEPNLHFLNQHLAGLALFKLQKCQNLGFKLQQNTILKDKTKKNSGERHNYAACKFRSFKTLILRVKQTARL